jgi:tRNA nucleotidyltransferase/poly(A) polymerase
VATSLGKDMPSAREAAAREITTCLQNAGYLAFFVGGCVRDRLLGLEPHDYDVVTDATPAEIQRLFPKTAPVGAAFGTVLVMHNGYQYEVSTFRGLLLPPRLPAGHTETVNRTVDPIELVRCDSLHRDFTINAMAADPETGQIYDFVNGRGDLEHKRIRAVESAQERFVEDPLRMLRAIRFTVQLGFTLDPKTEAAVGRRAPEITLASSERIHQELLAILLSPSPALGFRLLHRTGLLETLLPEVAAMEGVAQPPEFHPEGDVWTHTLLMLEQMEHPSAQLALGVLLHDVGKPPTFRVFDRIRFDRHCEVGVELVQRIAGRYRWPRAQIEAVCALVQDHLVFLNVRAMRRSTLLRWLRKPHFPELLELHRLDCLGSHRSLSTYEFCRTELASLTPAQARPVPLLTGDDLKGMGYLPGPRYKEILAAVEDAQLEGLLRSTEQAEAWVNEHFPLPNPPHAGSDIPPQAVPPK